VLEWCLLGDAAQHVDMLLSPSSPDSSHPPSLLLVSRTHDDGECMEFRGLHTCTMTRDQQCHVLKLKNK
jgi:hypothetical protein